MFRLFWVELVKRRVAIFGWGLGLAAYGAMVTAIAPELASQLGAIDLQSIAIYAAMGITTNIDSALSMLSMYIPFMGLMAAAYALIAGVNALAGEEENGTLENVLAMPLRRRRIVIAKAWALAVAVALVLFIAFLGYAVAFLAIQDQLESSITLEKLLLGSLEPWPLCFAFAMLGMLLGAFLPRRMHALMIGLIILIAAYFINNLAAISPSLETLQPFSPFYYYGAGAALTDSPDVNNILILLGIGLGALLLALISFQRRDVTVGQWPWQRRRAPQP